MCGASRSIHSLWVEKKGIAQLSTVLHRTVMQLYEKGPITISLTINNAHSVIQSFVYDKEQKPYRS